MTGCTTWSYRPYRPLLWNTGDIYICRIAPGAGYIHLEWLNEEERVCTLFLRKRGEGDFLPVLTSCGTELDITGLETDAEYEFYLRSGELKSRVRLARTSEAVGTVVNYLHPEDEVYAFSGRYLCSPSLVRHPEGFLLASMDLFAGEHPQNLTLIFRSDDDGKHWHYVSELMPCFWGKLFVHQGALYMLSCSTEYGDLLIGRSDDGGRTFSAPVTLLRGSNGKNGNSGVHKNPQNVMHFGGRLYETLEWGAWANRDYCHAAMVMSCDENADLLDPASWHFSPPMPFGPFAPEIAHLPGATMTIEGTLVIAPDGRLKNIMRFGMPGHVLCYDVDTEDPDGALRYDRILPFPANYSKFMIKFDPVSRRYYSIGSRLVDPNTPVRNLLSLLVSEDLTQWRVAADLLDYRDADPQQVGFQYVDFEMEGDDILFLCRTALNGAHNFHDANYSTFHRIPNFRNL